MWRFGVMAVAILAVAFAAENGEMHSNKIPNQPEGKPEAEGQPKQPERNQRQPEIEPRQPESNLKQGESKPKQLEGNKEQAAREPEQVESQPKQSESNPKQAESDPKQQDIHPKRLVKIPRQIENKAKVESNSNQQEIHPRQMENFEVQPDSKPKQPEINIVRAQADQKPAENQPREVERIVVEWDNKPSQQEMKEKQAERKPEQADIKPEKSAEVKPEVSGIRRVGKLQFRVPKVFDFFECMNKTLRTKTGMAKDVGEVKCIGKQTAKLIEIVPAYEELNKQVSYMQHWLLILVLLQVWQVGREIFRTVRKFGARKGKGEDYKCRG